jgi:hypothetical protein
MKFMAAVGASVLMLTGAMATTAAAQPWRDRGPAYDDDRGNYRGEYRGDRRGGHRGGNLTSSYVDSLDWRLDNAAREGRLPWGHARELRRELHQVQPLAWRVETGQASQWEYRRLSNVVSRIEAAINHSRYSDNRRWR